MKNIILKYLLISILFLIISSVCCKANDGLLIAFEDKYCIISYYNLLSNSNNIVIEDCEVPGKVDNELEILSKSFPMTDRNQKLSEYKIKKKYYDFFKKAQERRERINNDYVKIRKMIGTPGSRVENRIAYNCKSGYNFIHDGIIIFNSSIYFYAGKGNWEKFHDLPDGEYPLCCIDTTGQIKLITTYNNYGRLFSPREGNYYFVGSFVNGPNSLFAIEIQSNKIALMLKDYKIIGELNKTQSLIYNNKKEIFIFDHTLCKLKKISDLDNEDYIIDIEDNEGDTIKEWDSVISSKKEKMIILHGYRKKDNERKESLFVFQYNKKYDKFKKITKDIVPNKIINALVIVDDQFYYLF
jgi:hypothetical protein